MGLDFLIELFPVRRYKHFVCKKIEILIFFQTIVLLMSFHESLYNLFLLI